ncbi:3-hydroxyisobutyrate dehydrogenase [Hyphomicrobium denitrificans ATCC 51888]|uniref:3-hydroxyisobutyrate dehydrogenase n=1 Tax=Hyphomicrobium denitrificans (strain ATCC 51888 / DSM 1869 / NCIMB 11706 / TK 0415) TaxID=582899 RepID=D8JZ59_HYPDA|nr:NAD(P)-dependent oxidoreductase [Hyphomicrobium denitrificans]ADJ23661.1 3-hydroxyisobutyrate dehydrogenase [Hyphomicrobium denitrificans ATCC 51888]
MAKVAWLGLGVMGYPMAGHLKTRGGHDVVVYNRSAEKAAKWREQFGGETASTPAEAARDCDAVFACVGNDDDVRSVTTGPDGAFQAMKPGAIFIDHTTASAQLARELASAAEARGLHFLDCPVSGGQSGAEAGALTVMAGGDEAAYARAEPLIAAFARSVRRMGPSGSGQLAKMCNQIAVAGVVQGLAEAIYFAEHAGLDIEALIATISKGAAQSWQMENRWKTMHAREFDFGFAVDWMRKDLGICLSEAASNGAELPATRLIDSFYAQIAADGGGRWDTSSLIARLDPKSGNKPKS